VCQSELAKGTTISVAFPRIDVQSTREEGAIQANRTSEPIVFGKCLHLAFIIECYPSAISTRAAEFWEVV
jgi:hypothetical protein